MRSSSYSLYKSRSVANKSSRRKLSYLNSYIRERPPIIIEPVSIQIQERRPKISFLQEILRTQKKIQNDISSALWEVEKSKKLLSVSQDGAVLESCQICLNYMSTDFFPLTGCTHTFDHSCLREYIMTSVEDGKFPIMCPYKECSNELSIANIKFLLSEAEMERFYLLSFKNYALRNSNEIIGCPTPGCEYYGFMDSENQIAHFCCPECGLEKCLKCDSPWHAGMTCKAAKINARFAPNDRKFQQFLQNLNYGKCPNCRIIIEKAEVGLTITPQGCNVIQCKCGELFCQICHLPHSAHSLRDWRKHEMQLSRVENEEKLKERFRPKDAHSLWIEAERERLTKEREERSHFIAKPVPLYPPPPKTLINFMTSSRKLTLLRAREKADESGRMASTSNSFFKYSSVPPTAPSPITPSILGRIQNLKNFKPRNNSRAHKKAHKSHTLKKMM